MSTFRLENLKKIYNTRIVLDIPEYEIHSGKVYSLLGPNGSGKSTLMQILGFLSGWNEGRLFFRNNPVHFTKGNLTALRRKVILVEQRPIMFSTTVFKNVEYGLRLRKIPGKTRVKTVEAALEQVGMRDFAKAMGNSLSGGEMQRVAIARALACDPEVLLLDEPTASVDSQNRRIIEEILLRMKSVTGKTIIFSTHERLQAKRLCDETITLFEGRIFSRDYENTFTGYGSEDDNGGGSFRFPSARLRIPLPCRKTGKLTISIPSRKIAVSPEKAGIPHADHSAFSGIILQVILDDNGAKVIVDAGVVFHAKMHHDAFMKTGLKPGDRVLVSFSKADIRVFENRMEKIR